MSVARDRGVAKRATWAWSALLCLVGAWPAAAQLSPGELSRPHAQLEGSAHCLDCHESRKGVDPRKCLDCHELLAARVRIGEGLHARDDYADCKTCHIDHHGLEFELVWWGEEGIDSFDHQLTGHPLAGAHQTLDCRQCHRAPFIAEPDRLTLRDKDLDRTFLGLRPDCLSCHADEHRGQLAGRACEECHGQQAWKPADGFDHQQAAYALTGRHREVECVECHTEERDDRAPDDVTFLRLTGLSFGNCSSCHDDPHASRFGGDCQSCHSTDGWMVLDDRQFDHRLTRYPLTGRHRQVECDACHRPGTPRGGLPFDRCTDCHDDAHLGQLADRPDGGACESCHDVEGFSPARYTVDDHQRVFALEGGHLALECDACHKPVAPSELIRLGVVESPGRTPGAPTPQLRYSSTHCVSCHADPHDGVNASLPNDPGCPACHSVAAWQQVEFDHASTGFVVDGPHAPLGCRECHAPATEDDSAPAPVETTTLEALSFGGLGTACASCHDDPHVGQFDAPAGGRGCERCHSGATWKPAAGFDHDRDSVYRLEGAHLQVSCDGCHPSEIRGGETFVRFRPLGTDCSDCHGGREAGSGRR